MIDYISVADKVTLEEIDTLHKPAMASCAILIGETRLIDNVLLENIESRVDTPPTQSYNSPS
jgi:pantothenate synthetase